MSTSSSAAAWLVALSLALPAVASAAPAADKGAADKGAADKAAPTKPEAAPSGDAVGGEMNGVIKKLIGAVRYSRDASAVATFAGDAQGAFLCGESWGKATDAQKKEFVELFHKMFAAIAFPNIRKNFEKLETILYDAPTIRGDKATLGSTIVILHPMKKQEIVATYDMLKQDGTWKVVDVTVKGDKSMLTNIRDEQVQKILASGGFDKLLDLMRKRVAKAGN